MNVYMCMCIYVCIYLHIGTYICILYGIISILYYKLQHIKVKKKLKDKNVSSSDVEI